MTSQSATETVLSREELYSRVWETPLQTLAPEFGLSDVGLSKVCIRHEIPTPSRGHWAKLQHGKPSERLPLLRASDESLELIRIRAVVEADGPAAGSNIINPEIAERIQAELSPDNRIEVVKDFKGAHPIVAATREALAQSGPNYYGRVYPRNDPQGACFEVSVAKAHVHRALLLLHTVVRALCQRGFELTARDTETKGPTFNVLGMKVTLSVWEPSRRTRRQLTKAERDEKAKYGWTLANEYDYVPQGHLELHANRSSYMTDARVSDSPRKPVEAKLNAFLVQIYRKADKVQVAADLREQEAKAAQLRMLAAIEQEVVRRSDSVRKTRMRYATRMLEKANRIRHYIEAVRQEAIARAGAIDENSEVGRWLNWAVEAVKPLDPTNERYELPTYSLSEAELASLRKECQRDWVSYDECFRPRQPR